MSSPLFILPTFLGPLIIQPTIFNSQTFDLPFGANHFISGPVSFFVQSRSHIFHTMVLCLLHTGFVCIHKLVEWYFKIPLRKERTAAVMPMT